MRAWLPEHATIPPYLHKYRRETGGDFFKQSGLNPVAVLLILLDD
jgi:hypothetical protein